jgi:hypothetical protein
MSEPQFLAFRRRDPTAELLRIGVEMVAPFLTIIFWFQRTLFL